jgi:hypothetical protein
LSRDAQLVLFLSAMHLGALAIGAVLLTITLRREGSDEHLDEGDDEDGGGGIDRRRTPPRRPTPKPSAGPPLPDATTARVRLREPARLGALVAPPGRREPRRRRAPGVPRQLRAEPCNDVGSTL